MRSSLPALALWLLAAGCGSSSPLGSASPGSAERSPTVATELSPVLAPLAWWLGDWEAEGGGSSQHWIAAAGAIYGVALQGEGAFEILIVDDGDGPGKPDGELRLIALPGGQREIEYRRRELGGSSALFAREGYDFPTTIGYARQGEALVATRGGDAGRREERRLRRGAARRAPALEAADRAFAEDVARRGAVGWAAAFDPKGWMLRNGSIVQGDAIRERMQPLLTAGMLAWAPIASGAHGALGFTVGKATYTAGTPGESWRSTYVTIWRKQADGGWKVLFDTGRIVQD